MTAKGGRRGEFELIASLFAPLARKEPGAFNLTDDAALLKPMSGHDFVVTTDAIVAGVHFFANDPPDMVAQKALRVNLSDLAAKGAVPRAYLLTAALSPEIDDAWLKSFVKGLRRDQKTFSVTLVGGDTVATPGPATFNIVAIGDVPQGRMLRRAGARAGDDVWVSGTIGDAALGLRVLKGERFAISPQHERLVVKRYLVPAPRVGLGRALLGLAGSCLDVSDGLVADLGHIAENSKVGIDVDAEAVPLSAAAAASLAVKGASLSELLVGGDDYELIFTAPGSVAKELASLSKRSKLPLTRIGKVVPGGEVIVRRGDGGAMRFDRRGYRHF